MPMRNAERFVAAAIRSILHQPGADVELVVVDDGSRDRSRSVACDLQDPRIRVVSGPCRGISAAMNTGLASARAAIVMRCDADDLYPPGRPGWQTRWLDEHPEFGAVCGSFATMDPQACLIGELPCGDSALEITDELRRSETRTHFCAFAARTELVRQAGGFRDYFITAEDIDLQLRLGEVTRVWYEPRVCYYYRLHGGSITHTQPTKERLFFEEAARRFQAQRHGTGADDLDRGHPPMIPKALSGATIALPAVIGGQLWSQAWRSFGAGRYGDAMRTGLRACRSRPASWDTWRNMLALTVKTSLRR